MWVCLNLHRKCRDIGDVALINVSVNQPLLCTTIVFAGIQDEVLPHWTGGGREKALVLVLSKSSGEGGMGDSDAALIPSLSLVSESELQIIPLSPVPCSLGSPTALLLATTHSLLLSSPLLLLHVLLSQLQLQPVLPSSPGHGVQSTCCLWPSCGYATVVAAALAQLWSCYEKINGRSMRKGNKEDRQQGRLGEVPGGASIRESLCRG